MAPKKTAKKKTAKKKAVKKPHHLKGKPSNNPDGVPKKKVKWSVVAKLLKMQCTGEEIAGFLDINYSTLASRCIEEKGVSFSQYSEQKKKGGKSSLRRRQWLMAKDTPSMAIWLGKQYLDQSDKGQLDIGGTDKPIKHEIGITFVKPKN